MSVSLQITRYFSITKSLMARRLSKRSNPGLGHLVSAIDEAAEAMQSDPEGFGGLESDLMNAHKTHKQHELELRQQKEKLRHFLVKKKYFRDDPLPNLLTYAEKEQIRILHSRDPEEWSVDRLAESFPANNDIIRKILKANWKPTSVKRIRSHDAGAFENWELFKKGALKQKLPKEFQEHLNKFADRRSEDLKTLPDPATKFSKTLWQKPKSNEFLSIISLRTKEDCANNTVALTDGHAKHDLQFRRRVTDDDETYLLSKVQNRQQMRIKELKESKLTLDTSANDCSAADDVNPSSERRAALALKNSCGTGIVKGCSKTSVLNYTDKFASNEVSISEHDRNRFEMAAVKNHIHIPRKLWRKGATYRVEDSYYDDDGEFLYRVPGMTGQ